MFDFTNYTYSGVVSVLSALFGLSYPLILGCIEKIDSKYHSTRLSARFLEEWVFIVFKYLLVVNLLLAVLIPFLMDGNTHARCLIAIQSFAAMVLIWLAFQLFNKILAYYDAAKLQEQILADYHKAVRKVDKELEAKFFTQWSDLTSVLLSSADERLVQSVYEEWYDYVSRKYKEYTGRPQEMDDYFYDAVTRINENLCKEERRPISVNNGNSLLTSMIEINSIVTEKTYRYLWKNLRLQLFYGRDEWIMAYWKMASQKYDFYMKSISIFDRDDSTGDNYTEEQVNEREQQRESFLEFHLMLCAMLLQEGKYTLLQQMMFYSQTQPPTYPLVPSTLAEILVAFEKLNEDRLWDISYFESRYPMPNMHGITGGKILGAANCYMALLVYRLYMIDYPYGHELVFRTLGLPNNQSELAKYKRDLDSLNYWLEKIKNNKEALEATRISDIGDIAEESKVVGTPKQIITAIQSTIDTKLNDLKEHQPNDPGIIDELEKEVNRKMLMALAPIGDIWGKRFERDICYHLNASVSQIYPNTAFQANPEVSHGGIPECVFEGMWHTYSHLLASSFYQERMVADYTIDSSLLFDGLDRIGVGDDYFAIATGLYMDYYTDKVKELVKLGDRLYSYKGMQIISFGSPSQYFSQRVYVTKKDDRPYIVFQEPNEEQKNTMELKKFNQYDLWMSVQRVEDHENALSEEYKKKLGDQKNMYSMFHAIWMPKLFFKEEYKMVCLKVKYRMSDEGAIDTMDKIRPFEEGRL